MHIDREVAQNVSLLRLHLMEQTLSSKIYSYVCLRVTKCYISYKVKVLKEDLVKVQQSGKQICQALALAK